jgi:hypothetical protein
VDGSPSNKENTMKITVRQALWVLPALAGIASADSHPIGPTRASPNQPSAIITTGGEVIKEESVIIEEGSVPSTSSPVEAVPEEVISTPPRRIFQNPPSRVVQGPLVRRVIPNRYAKPFNKGPYRYEPRLGDIRNLPKQLTLPGNEGERETLYSLPPRDRGYFILNRW